MKTFHTTIALFALGIFTLGAHAQTVVYGGTPSGPHGNSYHPGNPNGNAEHKTSYVNGGSVTLSFGSYPNNMYGNGYYNNYNGYNGYNNFHGNGAHSVKRAARYSINRSGAMISDAMNFQAWNDMYSPLLAKAIRHQEYARQLYWWGNYQDAYNHAERASYLAWYVMSYYNNGYYGNGYNNGYGSYQPNPYSDPYNPYYKQGNPNTNPGNDPMYQPNNGYNGMKQAPGAGNSNTNGNGQNKMAQQPKLESNDLDNSLPASKSNDRELLRSIDTKDLMVE